MADRTLPLARVQVGPPHIDGLILEHGWGYSWRFRDKPTDPSQPVWQCGISWLGKSHWLAGLDHVVGDKVRGQEDGRFVNEAFNCTTAHTSSADDEPPVGVNWRDYWERGQTEIIPELDACGPRGRVAQSENFAELAQWDVQEPNSEWWREARPAGGMELPHLHFYKAYARSEGSVISKWTAQNFWVRLLRAAPIDGETWPPQVSLSLYATTPEDILHQWQLRLPAFTDEPKYPSLWKYPEGGVEPELYAEWQAGSGASSASGQRFMEQQVWIEQVGPYLRIWLSNANDTWLVKRPDNPNGEAFDFKLALHVQGHVVMALPQPLVYPAYAEVRPRGYMALGEGWNELLQHRTSKHEPDGTTVAVETEVDPANPRGYRPKITIVTVDVKKRSVLWRVDTHAPPVYQAAKDAMADQRVTSVSWRRNNRWRGAEFTAELAQVDDPPDYKGNNKGSLEIATYPAVGPVVWTKKVTGYLAMSEPQVADPSRRPKARTMQITARDGVSARLPKHRMTFTISPCGWTVGDWFPHILEKAGVPAALIDVDADVADMEITDLDPRSDPRFDYGHDQGVVQALDEVLMDSMGLLWGNNEDGMYFVRRPAEWSPGDVPDWTLDEDTVSETDTVHDLKSSRSADDFRNYVLGIVRGAQGTAFALNVNRDSHIVDTDDRYIGEDWWEVVMAADDDSAGLAAAREFVERQKWGNLIVWKTGLTALNPDDFVQVEVDKLRIPAGSIFQIVSETGSIDANTKEAEQEFVGRIVRYGS